jgi:hypothetical protein
MMTIVKDGRSTALLDHLNYTVCLTKKIKNGQRTNFQNWHPADTGHSALMDDSEAEKRHVIVLGNLKGNWIWYRSEPMNWQRSSAGILPHNG